MKRLSFVRLIFVITSLSTIFNYSINAMYYGESEEELEEEVKKLQEEELEEQELEELEEKLKKQKEKLNQLYFKRANEELNDICENFKKLEMNRFKLARQIKEMQESFKHLLYFYYFVPGFKQVKKAIDALLTNNFLPLMAQSLSQPCINVFGPIFDKKCLIKFSHIRGLYTKRKLQKSLKKEKLKPHTIQQSINKTRCALLTMKRIVNSISPRSQESIKIVDLIDSLLKCPSFTLSTNISKDEKRHNMMMKIINK